MPKSTNKFQESVSYDHVIVSAENDSKIGELRVKPSSILWKPKGAQKWYSVSLEEFGTWISTTGKSVKK